MADCPLGENVPCQFDRRGADAGVQMILDQMHGRFGRIETKLDEITQLRVDVRGHDVKIENIESAHARAVNGKWALGAAVAGAWIIHLLNWLGGKR